MKRLIVFFALLFALLGRALAVQVVLPTSFVNGQIIDASLVMGDYNAIVTVVNGNLDHSNFASGSGLYASDIKPPSSGAATVGGAVMWTFPNGIALSNVGASLPLCTDANNNVVTSGCSQLTGLTASAPLAVSAGLTPNLSLSGIVPVANGGTGSATQNFVDLTSDQSISGIKTFNTAIGIASGGTGANSFSAAHLAVTNAANTFSFQQIFSNGLSVPANPTNGVTITPAADGELSMFRITNAGSTLSMLRVDSLDGSNAVEYVTHGGTLGAVPPILTPSGSQVASTLHGVLGTCTFSSASTCTVTFSNGAVWAAATSYNCEAESPISGAHSVPTNATTTTIVFNFYNVNGTVFTGSGTVAFFCLGT